MTFSYQPFRNNTRLALAAQNRPPLKRGDRGSAIVILQEALIGLGYALPRSTKPDGSLDGVYGSEVADIITDVQKKNSLSRDGQAGRNTLGVIDSLLGGGRTVPPETPAAPWPSAFDLALLSDDVYTPGKLLSRGSPWSIAAVVDDATNGLAAAFYRLSDSTTTVVSLRGTEAQRADLLNDVMMIPKLPPGAAKRTLEDIFRQYDIQRELDRFGLIGGLGALLDLVIGYAHTNPNLAQHINRVPDQADTAEKFIDSVHEAPVFLTGHSLGGALAKVVSMRKNIPCVAFNSPYMGDLRGTTPVTSPAILSINASHDPLSMATRSVGNLSHGGDIILKTDPPPGVEAMLRRHRDRTRTVPPWARWHPVGYLIDYIDSAYDDYDLLLDLLVKMAIYYHGLADLRAAMLRQSRFTNQLTSDFSGLF